jgi:hypothetical protein
VRWLNESFRIKGTALKLSFKGLEENSFRGKHKFLLKDVL